VPFVGSTEATSMAHGPVVHLDLALYESHSSNMSADGKVAHRLDDGPVGGAGQAHSVAFLGQSLQLHREDDLDGPSPSVSATDEGEPVTAIAGLLN
jgi:hypothetical protein